MNTSMNNIATLPQPNSSTATRTASAAQLSTVNSAAVLRTPYHSLSDEGDMHIPAWAQHRSVYRSSGRTLYLVDTDQFASARSDLDRLGRAGWNVQVAEHPAGALTRIALTRREVAQAA